MRAGTCAGSMPSWAERCGYSHGFCPANGAVVGVCEKDLDKEDQGDATGPDDCTEAPWVLSYPVPHATKDGTVQVPLSTRKFAVHFSGLAYALAVMARRLGGLGGRAVAVQNPVAVGAGHRHGAVRVQGDLPALSVDHYEVVEGAQ
jgi:hypothetical protein